MPVQRIGAATLVLVLVGCVEDVPTQVDDVTADPSAVAAAADRTPGTITLERIGEFDGGGEAAAEITAFDAVSKRLFVVNGTLGTVDVLELRDPSWPVHVGVIDVTPLGAGANGIAAHGGIVAIAIEAHERTAPGAVAFYRAPTLELISSATVGSLPDMVTFSPDGRVVLVANEGEPNADYTVDPEGSVSIIDVHNVNRPVVRMAGFSGWNGRRDELLASGVRIFGPGASVAQDLEPEYIAVSPDGATAWATLQENDALALIDVASAMVVDILPLGYKDHSLAGAGFDASDRDNAVNIRPWPVLGMYQPDAIAAYDVGGRTFLVTANEGDAREYEGSPGFTEEARVSSLTLDPTVFTDAVCGGPCGSSPWLGRLNVTRTLGLNPQTNQYEALYSFGARSISIWTADGTRVWDSDDALERLTASLPMVSFNASNDSDDFDNRSDNKGPEPEGVVLGRLGRKTFAFAGLERVGGVVVYDVSNPYAPQFVTYVNTRNGISGDLGPEGVTFVSARQAPGGEPLLIVGNEISGTTAIFRIALH